MPPLPVYPNMPAGSPDINWPSMVGSPTYSASSQSAGSNANGPSPQQWDQYVQQVQQALQASAGFERTKLQKQYEDAQKGRDNAYKIAQLQSDTSRYGTDASREVQLKQLQESQRQFDANHGLEMQKFSEGQRQFDKTYGLSEAGVTGTYNGTPTEAARQFNANFGEGQRQYNTTYGLNRADAIAKYSSTPDQMFMRQDLIDALGNAEQGYGPSPYGANGAPRAKTVADFDAISGPPGSFRTGEYRPGTQPSDPLGPYDPSGGRGFVPPQVGSGASDAGGGGDPSDMIAPHGSVPQAPQAPANDAGSGGGGQWQDYAALQGYGSLPAVAAGRTSTGAGGAGMSAAVMPSGGMDPRVKAGRAILDAIPPSDTDGHDTNDYAALQAISGLFKARKPGSYERLRPGQQQAVQGGLARSGAYAPDVLADYDRSLPRQSSVRAA